MLNSFIWSGPDTIINVRDTMQNPGKTQIYYKPGQNHMTQMTWIQDGLAFGMGFNILKAPSVGVVFLCNP